MKEAMKMGGPNFCARRMAKEYAEKFYRKAIDASMRSAYRREDVSEADLFNKI